MPSPEPQTSSSECQGLLDAMRAFCFPGGEDAARLVAAVRTTQKGEMRMSPKAKWIPFTAQEMTHATQSCFRWDARLNSGITGSLAVTDMFENGQGRLLVKWAGLLPIQDLAGPDLDQGELQRFLSSIAFCPPILLNHPALECSLIGPRSLRLGDRNGPPGATVDFEIGEDGAPLACLAYRPRRVGKQSIWTPWSARCIRFTEWDGLRVATQFEAAWHLEEGPFPYFRSEITAIQVLR